MAPNKLLRQLATILIFRIGIAFLVAGIVWSGYQVANAVVRQIDEREAYIMLISEIDEIATTAAPSETSPPTELPSATLTNEPTQTPVIVSATGIPSPTSTTTEMPTSTSTDLPVATQAPTLTYTMNASAQVQNQFSATNTPVQAVFATNTPASQNISPTALPTNTPPPPTPLPQPTVTPTFTATSIPTGIPTAASPQIEATRPLPTVFFAVEPEEGLVAGGTAVPTRVPTVPRPYDLLNVLLLGGDDTLTDGNTVRTDTMIVVSVNRDTGTVSMLSLPRDMYVWIPSGFDGQGFMGRLNVAYGVGENIGYTGGGFGLLRQTILYNFGINTHYYARVNFDGFQDVIDTLGGVEIAVDCAYQDYALIGAEVPGDAIEVGEDGLWTLPIGYYEMSGSEALWYARTRGNSDDFDRGRRQQQIIRAIWRTMRDTGRLDFTTIPSLWNQTMNVVETDMTLTDILGLLPVAIDLDVSDVEQFTLIRTYHTQPWQPPDGTFVQLPVYDTLRPLLEDFYLPPTDSELVVIGASVAIYNGTDNDGWDLVAADSLQWNGFRAWSAGAADGDEVHAETILIDRTGQQKGSSRNAIAAALNISPENIQIEPQADREADFEVILGANYDSCDAAVLEVETPEAE